MKQLGLSVMMYTDDYDETYPFGSSGYWTGASAWGGFVDCIYPYVKNKKMFVCPSDGTKDCVTNSTSNFGSNTLTDDTTLVNKRSNVFLSYAYNHALEVTATGALTYPADTAMMVEHIQRPYFYSNFGQSITDPNTYYLIYAVAGTGAGDRVLKGARHNEGMNMNFADGHAKYVKKGAIANVRAIN